MPQPDKNPFKPGTARYRLWNKKNPPKPPAAKPKPEAQESTPGYFGKVTRRPR